MISTFWAIKTALLIIVNATIPLLNLFLLSTWNGVSFDQHPVSWEPVGLSVSSSFKIYFTCKQGYGVFTFLHLANFIHAHVLLQTSTFPLVNSWALCYGHEPHLTHSSAGGYLGYFYCLVIVTSAATLWHNWLHFSWTGIAGYVETLLELREDW